MLNEAFRRALLELDSAPGKGHVEARTLHLVRTAVEPASGGREHMSHAAWAKSAYRAQKLTRRWTSVVRADALDERTLRPLQDEWIALVHEFLVMDEDQRVALLQEIVNSLALDARERPFLLRQALAHPIEAQTLRERLGFGWCSREWGLLCMTAELSDLSSDERDAFQVYLNDQAPPVLGPECSWLIDGIAHWLVDRYQLASSAIPFTA